MTYKWNYQPPTQEELQERDRLVAELGLSPVISLLLVQRGLTTREAIKKFFKPSLNDLEDPFLMPDMDKAVERLNQALGDKEKILIYGDYDVDGTTAVSLVYKYLRPYTSSLDYYIPDRYDEGSGISFRGVDYAAEQGVTLIISLDCGIKAHDKVAYAKEKGIDFIVCDHHMPDETLPDAVAVLDAKREDSKYPYEHLSGCGVGFKFMQAFAINNGFPFSELEKLLELVAMSIASDIVPITGENRVLAYYGLRQINSNPSIGMKSIIDVCGLSGKEITISDIVFKIGPRLNASGRMMNGREAVELMLAKDSFTARKKSESINQYNDERRELDKKITEEASRLIAQSEFLTGSARSVVGFDIYAAIENCRDLLENFGGHTYAVGFSLKEENLEAFKEKFQQTVADQLGAKDLTPQIDIDAILDFKEITPKFLRDLKEMGPFGPENQKPIFCTRAVKDYGTSKLVGRELEHIKLEIIDSLSDSSPIIHAIAFGMSRYNGHIKQMKPFDICYTVEENTYNKNTVVQLQVKDIRI